MSFGSKNDEEARLAALREQQEAIAAILGDVGGTMVDPAQAKVNTGSQVVTDARPPCKRCCGCG
ncbi:MAG: hypothetical protein MRY32_01665 [Rickettsiales bacterium]|nr:hypothetical protein [Rickettsiales bacterium]